MGRAGNMYTRGRAAIALAATLLLAGSAAIATGAPSAKPGSGGVQAGSGADGGTTSPPVREGQGAGSKVTSGPGGVSYRRIQGQVTGGFEVAPSRITASDGPGSTSKETLIIANLTGRHARFSLTIRDLGPGTGTAYSKLLDPGTLASSAASWVLLPVVGLELDNMQEAEVPLRVVVPAGVKAGGHYAAIVVATTRPGTPSAAGTVTEVVTQIVTQVVAIVPGAIHYDARATDFSVSAATRGSLPVKMVIENTGNIHTAPRVSVRFRGIGVDHRVSADLPELLPDARRPLTVTWSGLPPLARVTPTVIVTTEDGGRWTRELDPVWVWSVGGLALLALLLLGLPALVWAGLRWRRRSLEYLDYMEPGDMTLERHGHVEPDPEPEPEPEPDPEPEPRPDAPNLGTYVACEATPVPRDEPDPEPAPDLGTPVAPQATYVPQSEPVPEPEPEPEPTTPPARSTDDELEERRRRLRERANWMDDEN